MTKENDKQLHDLQMLLEELRQKIERQNRIRRALEDIQSASHEELITLYNAIVAKLVSY